jgi:hypothetical protein
MDHLSTNQPELDIKRDPATAVRSTHIPTNLVAEKAKRSIRKISSIIIGRAESHLQYLCQWRTAW